MLFHFKRIKCSSVFYNITLADVAKELSVSPQYLSNIFSKENGVTITTYINQLRLKKSSEMLIYTDKSITEICFECGFKNLSYFLRNFKSKYKVSPKQYRKTKCK